MSEKSFRNRICKELRKCNALVFPIIGGKIEREDGKIYTQNPGMPDIYIVHKYIGGIWIEFKAVNGKLSEKQRITIREMNLRAANTAFVARELSGGEGGLLDEEGNMLGFFENGKELIGLIQEIKK